MVESGKCGAPLACMNAPMASRVVAHGNNKNKRNRKGCRGHRLCACYFTLFVFVGQRASPMGLHPRCNWSRSGYQVAYCLAVVCLNVAP